MEFENDKGLRVMLQTLQSMDQFRGSTKVQEATQREEAESLGSL